ncbi:hypothetical protein GF348_09340 [candidate division KSB3 bacterium]|nr:hypothetical protein [candidate division KSB3 bacterium]
MRKILFLLIFLLLASSAFTDDFEDRIQKKVAENKILDKWITAEIIVGCASLAIAIPGSFMMRSSDQPVVTGGRIIVLTSMVGLGFGIIGYIDTSIKKKKNQDRISQLRKNQALQEDTGLTSEEKDAIQSNTFFVGMSRDALIRSLGAPDEINKSVGEWGTHEQFIYERSGKSIYVYVENGEVTAYQD